MAKKILTFIATVLNEENTIGLLLDSLIGQTLLPNEVILVDGGSVDRTVEKIKSQKQLFEEKNIAFHLIVKQGNRAVGRNKAIRFAKGEIIACTDAGCILDKNWLKNIIYHFNDSNVDVVAGYYEVKTNSIFGKCLAPYVLVMPDRVNPSNFLPATRSMAFRKKIWEKIGGFPEKYSHNEDYVFSKALLQKKAKIIFQKNAIVYWLPRKNIKEAFIMFFRFALGDIEAHIFRPKAKFVFLRYACFFFIFIYIILNKSLLLLYVLFLFILLYIIWSMGKNFKYVKDTRALFILPLLQITSDISVLSGTMIGFAKQIWDIQYTR